MSRTLWVFVVLISLVIGGAALVHWALGVYAYLFTGLCIWLVCKKAGQIEGPSLPRMLFGWLPAMLADKSEWMD